MKTARRFARPKCAPRPAGGSANAYEAETDLTGAFTIALPESGDVPITVERDGYYTPKDYLANIEGSQQLRLAANGGREAFPSANVKEQTSPVDIGQTKSHERLSGAEGNDPPYANSHSLLSSLPLMQGALLDPAGSLHIGSGPTLALGGGVDAMTNQANPTAVSNVIGAPHYVRFLTDEGSHFGARIRFFGPAGKRQFAPRRTVRRCSSAWV